MTNQELVTKIEEWVDEHEWYVEEGFHNDDSVDTMDTYMIQSQSLITFIKKLLHE